MKYFQMKPWFSIGNVLDLFILEVSKKTESVTLSKKRGHLMLREWDSRCPNNVLLVKIEGPGAG